MSVVTRPSRSLRNPVDEPDRFLTRGWTKSSSGSVHTTSRRRSPSGSARTERTGPTEMTDRRWVGTVKISSWLPCGRRRGTGNVAMPCPTGSSMTDGSSGRAESLRTSSRPTARSPTVTRCCARSSTTAYRKRPRTNATAASSATVSRTATTSSSSHDSASPAHQAATVTTSAAQPNGLTADVTGRTVRAAGASARPTGAVTRARGAARGRSSPARADPARGAPGR
ncbi:hypothetical protein IU11_18255, partial [Cellulosimicrobium sp. MM]